MYINAKHARYKPRTLVAKNLADGRRLRIKEVWLTLKYVALQLREDCIYDFIETISRK